MNISARRSFRIEKSIVKMYLQKTDKTIIKEFEKTERIIKPYPWEAPDFFKGYEFKDDEAKEIYKLHLVKLWGHLFNKDKTRKFNSVNDAWYLKHADRNDYSCLLEEKEVEVIHFNGIFITVEENGREYSQLLNEELDD